MNDQSSSSMRTSAFLRAVSLIKLELWLLAIILLIAGCLRFSGVSYGLPYTVRPDEPTMVNDSLRIFKTGDWNPHSFGYPSMMYYFNAIGYAVYFLIGQLVGWFNTPADFPYPEIITTGVGYLSLPTIFLLSRSISATLGTLSVLVVWLTSYRLSISPFVRLFATAAVAVSPALVEYSQIIAPDIFALFFLVLSFLGAAGILTDGRMRFYILAGIAGGLAVSGKYNAAPIIILLIVAHGLRYGWSGVWHKELYLGLVVYIVGFLFVTPYALLDWETFVRTVGSGATLYAVTGQSGQEGNTLSWYIHYLLNFEGWYIGLGFLQIIYSVYSRSRMGWLLLAFPVVYFLLVSQLRIRNERTIMLIVPFLALLAGQLLEMLGNLLQRAGLKRSWATMGISLLAVFLLSIPSQTVFAMDVRMNQIDSRDTARVWLDTNLPPGSRVVVEPYTAYVNSTRFVILGVRSLADFSTSWYVEHGFEYLVSSRIIFGQQPSRYVELFSTFPLVQQFNDNDYEIRVYKTSTILPSHRIAARFGNYGELIELVGYDSDLPQVVPGKPLTVNLWWRPVSESREPLELEMRLLDQNNHEIASARGDLFQSKGWRDGMFQTAWTFAVPQEISAGAYRVDVSVIQSRFSYRTPARTWAGEIFDLVSLGPW